jgi:hypothetical protein
MKRVLINYAHFCFQKYFNQHKMSSPVENLICQDLLKIKHRALLNGKYTDCTFVIGGDDKKKPKVRCLLL